MILVPFEINSIRQNTRKCSILPDIGKEFYHHSSFASERIMKDNLLCLIHYYLKKCCLTFMVMIALNKGFTKCR